MKRREVIFGLVLVCVLSLAFVVGASASSVDKVGYIFRKDVRVDENVIGVFEDLGFEVELINEADLSVDFSEYVFVFVGDEKFRNAEEIPVGNYKTLVINYHQSSLWGLTDGDGVSQMGSSAPLKVDCGYGDFEVYNSASRFGRVALPYYYLESDNKVGGFEQICSAQKSSSGRNFGDVVGCVEMNEKVCFFGIAKSDYWTSQARDLFEDIVEELVGEIPEEPIEDVCEIDSDCPEDVVGDLYCSEGNVVRDILGYSCLEGECIGETSVELFEECSYGCDDGICLPESTEENHDVGFIDFTDAVNGIKILKDGSAVLEEEELDCGEDYKVYVKVENFGDFVEGVSFEGSVGSVLFNHNPITDFEVGATSLKYKTVNMNLEEGTYTIRVETFIDGFADSDLANNVVEREVFVSC